MINDHQVKKLRTNLNGSMKLAKAAVRSGISRKTARKYRTLNQLPSEGPAKKIYFKQVQRSGDLYASDDIRMVSLSVTIAGQPFEHLLHHFVLTYSNWASVILCYSESFESLSRNEPSCYCGTNRPSSINCLSIAYQFQL